MFRKAIAGIFVSSLLFLTACPITPPPEAETPRDAFEGFTEAILAEDYARAYRFLSEDTRDRYPQNDFTGLFTLSAAGPLLTWKLDRWNIRDIRRETPRRAYITLVGPEGEGQSEYEMVREDVSGDDRAWRIRFYLADELNMPRRDEDSLFHTEQ